MTASWVLDIGGVTVALAGPAERIAPFANFWADWTGTDASWGIELVEDDVLPAPDDSYFAARPQFEDDGCTLSTTGFRGHIRLADQTAELRFHPKANDGDVAYFVRTVFALAAFDQRKLLFHSAGIVHHKKAYCLFGHSGSGKTTVSRLSKGKPVLSDDLLLLAPAESGVDVWATPFGRRRYPEMRIAPLRALLRLIQASEDRLILMPRSEALVDLVANSPVINANVEDVPQLIDGWTKMLSKIPVHRLYFRKANTFWEVIDAYFR